MTPSAPQHCTHEKMCVHFMHDSPIAHNDKTPCMRNHDGCKSCPDDTRKAAAIAEHNKRPRPPCEECVYEHQRALEIHWRDLFISDLRGSLEWDANHGNPELFKAVKTLADHYNKFTVDDHDARVRADVLDELSQWANKNNENHIDEDGDHLPCVITGHLINKINSLRGERK